MDKTRESFVVGLSFFAILNILGWPLYWLAEALRPVVYSYACAQLADLMATFCAQ
jgi:hypothetical protein